MGLSHVIPAGVVFIPIFFIVTTIPGISNTILQINEAAIDVSEVEEDILNTHFEISNLQSTGLNNRVFFDVTNTGTTKLWDYENFDVIITYEGIVNSTATNVTEKFTYSETGPSGDPILFDSASDFAGACLVLFGCQFSHTVTNSGDDRILIVGISKQNNAVVSSVEYGGQPMTLIRADDVAGDTNAHTSLYYLVNPPTGANDVDIRVLVLTNVVIGAVSFTGVDQATPINTHNGGTGNSAAPTVVLTTTADEAWLIDVVGTNGGTVSVGPGQVERWNDIQGSTRGSGSTEFTSSSSTFAMSWTKSAASNWAISAAALTPAEIPCCVAIGNWTISQITNDYTDPGIINKDEIAAIRIKTSHQIVTNGDVHVSFSAENGALATAFAPSS